jgi:hypothetical protein
VRKQVLFEDDKPVRQVQGQKRVLFEDDNKKGECNRKSKRKRNRNCKRNRNRNRKRNRNRNRKRNRKRKRRFPPGMTNQIMNRRERRRGC